MELSTRCSLTSLSSFFLLSFGLLCSPCLRAQNVLTFHNDLARTGANLNETVLTPSTVGGGNFGKVFSHAVDGYVYAQPLYVAGVPVAGKGRHNLLLVATEADSVYAFDADNANGANANPLWQASFANGTTVTPVPAAFGGGGENDIFGCVAINPTIGITGTPVIDPVSMTIYVVAATKESTGFVHRFHAVDITTGLERPGSGAAITVPNGVYYDPQYMVQRTGLLLLSGKVYAGFASSCDRTPYNGFLATFDSTTLRQTNAMFVPARFAGKGGIWAGGGAPAVDSTGNIYVGVGNGDFDGSTVFGCSLVKLNAQLQVTDYFSPFDVNTILNPQDLDLGASMPIILPDSGGLPGHPHLMAIGGKDGYLYLVDRDNLNQQEPFNNTNLPAPPQYAGGALMGRSAYFNGNLYVSPAESNVKRYSVANSLAQTGETSNTYGPWVGASLSVSANGSANGLLWVQSANADGFSPGGSSAVLEAYDAASLGVPLYSNTASSSDSLGIGVRWAVPSIAQGRVYAGAGAAASQGTIAAYGITNPTCAADVSSQVTVARGGWRFNRATNSYTEILTLTNTGSAPVGPVSVVFDSLSSYSMVTSASGTTTCGALTGSFYQSPSGTGIINPGQSVPVYLSATSSSSQTIEFTTRVLSGTGIR